MVVWSQNNKKKEQNSIPKTLCAPQWKLKTKTTYIEYDEFNGCSGCLL